MRAGILAVGTELLGSDRVESNSLLLSAALQRFGVPVQQKTVVGDVAQEIAAELTRMLEELDLVLVTGGLGPTSDDVTREAASQALGQRLVLDDTLLAEIRAKFRKFGMKMPEANRRQAELLEAAEMLPNPRGTAPGMRVDHLGHTLFLFPGVPGELRGLIDSALDPWLRDRRRGEELEVRVLRVACLPESELEQRIRPAYQEFGNRSISVLASPGDIQIRLTVRGSEQERGVRLREMSERFGQLVGTALYTLGTHASLEQVVGELLAGRGETVATAESCTGGLVAERITRVPGSSGYFVGAVVAYSDRQKEELLGVSPSTLAACGAVSREVALEMAHGVVERLGTDYGIALSGIAGPGGGSADKPVGTVHVALAQRDGDAGHRKLRFPGDREQVRWLASQWGLDLLRRRLLGVEKGA